MFNVLNLQLMQWSNWRENDIPEVDDFAHYFDKETGMLYCFGGYLNGVKSNILFKIDVNQKVAEILSNNTASSYSTSLAWQDSVPCQRTSSRMVYSPTKNALYLYGGLNIQNDTLNDMWRFDLETNQWDVIEQNGKVPGPRCGHSFNIHCDKIFMFGGLREVTQESNETFRFDIATGTWEEIGQSLPPATATARTFESRTSSMTPAKKKESSFRVVDRKGSFLDTIQPGKTNSDSLTPLQMKSSQTSLSGPRGSATPTAMARDVSTLT